MTARPTVLARLAWKFSHQPETVATEALGHILSESEAARNALGGFLRTHGADIGSVSRVETEVIGEEGEIPDLACRDQDSQERLLIELKFWAGLTDNQPVTYLKRLGKNKPSALLVVAPSLRIEPLWPELKRRVRQEMEVEPVEEETAREVRLAMVGTGRRLMLASWPVLLETLESRARASRDVQAVEDIRQLVGLAELQDRDAFLPLRPEHLDPEIARLIPNLRRLVRDVSERVLGTDWADGHGYAFAQAGGLYRFMSLGGCPVWFGLKYPLWSRFESSPLWVGFQQRARDQNVPRRLQERWGEKAPYSLSAEDVVPIYVPTGSEYHEVLDEVVKQLQRLAGLLQEFFDADADTRTETNA